MRGINVSANLFGTENNRQFPRTPLTALSTIPNTHLCGRGPPDPRLYFLFLVKQLSSISTVLPGPPNNPGCVVRNHL